MPEGDSVYQLARRLHPLVGATVTHTSLRVPDLATTSLTGHTLNNLWPYGKNLYMQFGDNILHTHLKMEGKWALHRQGTTWRAPGHTARVVLHFNTQPPSELVGHSLGFVRLLHVNDYPEHIKNFGPDLLAATFDHDTAAHNLAKRPDRPIGAALLDQSNLAGIGNEYRAEICFLCGVHPGQATKNTNIDQILTVSRRLMWANRLSPMRVTTGVKKAGENSYVFGRAGRPCRRCATPIVKDTLGGIDRGGDSGELERIIWWCPQCQPTPPHWQYDHRLTGAGLINDLPPHHPTHRNTAT
ncbi:DNA-formamidopyrimidine glycosylase family protein [Corynebacterium aquilae]|uniref:DNA-formamidopyrimidine glycosylase family protein n=1 Tax=Corynebacterium aquilae TaxID=203263 RepID=UPI000952B378|nr:DNA-formamidopyrimidine glycosylase family protein [Corynebacterium aquilae]